MENIKKIMLSLNDDNKIKRIVVVRNNKIERYYDKDLTHDELHKIYSDCVDELKVNYSKELEGLTINEQVQKLVKLGKIEENNENLIVKLETFEEERKFVIKSEEEIQEVKENELSKEEYHEWFDKTIKEICDTYDISGENFVELSKKLEKLDLYKEYKNEKEKDIETVLEENKVKNFKVNKKLLWGILGTGALALLVYGGIRLSDNNKETDTPITTPAPETTEKPEFKFEPVEVDEISYSETEDLEYNSEIRFLNEDTYFSDYEEPSNENILIKDVNGSEYFTVNRSFDELMDIRNEEISSVENNIQSNIPLENNGTYIYFENLFNNYELSDKAYVKYFSMLGNQIIKCAYKDGINNTRRDIQTYAKLSSYEVVRCIRDNGPIRVNLNGNILDLYYSDLSNEAKKAVLNIAYANYAVLNFGADLYHTDEQTELREEATVIEFRYNDEYITKSDIGDILLDAYNELNYTR